MIIDFHTHPLEASADIVFPVHTQEELCHIHFRDHSGELIKYMDRSGIDVSVVLPICAPNERVKEVVTKHKDRLKGFAYGWPGQDSREKLQYAVEELGLYGVKVFPAAHGLTLTSPEIQEICEEAHALRIPVLLDSAPPFMFHWYPRSYHQFECIPDRISQVSWEAHSVFRMLDSTFQGSPLVAAHLGGGLPLYFMWKGFREKYGPRISEKNVYFDISPPHWITPSLIKCAVDIMGADRLLFGSDTEYFFLQEKAIHNVKAAGLTEKQEEQIFCENARHLLHF